MTSDRGAALRAKYGTARYADPDAALRQFGLRDSVDPDEVFAGLYPSMEAAEAFAAADREVYGHATLGMYATPDGVVYVADLRAYMRNAEAPATP